MELLAKFLEFIHVALSVVSLTGGYWIPRQYLAIYVTLMMYLFIDWHDADRHCNLTYFTNRIRLGKEVASGQDGGPGFIQSILRKIGVNVSRRDLDRWLSIIVVLSWLVAYLRLVKLYKIRIFPNLGSVVVVTISVLAWLVSQFI